MAVSDRARHLLHAAEPRARDQAVDRAACRHPAHLDRRRGEHRDRLRDQRRRGTQHAHRHRAPRGVRSGEARGRLAGDLLRRSPLQLPDPGTLSSYWRLARAPRYSLLFALPLLVLYELSAFVLAGDAVGGMRNGADVLLKSLFLSFGGQQGLLVFNALLLGAGAVLVGRDLRKSRQGLSPGVFLGMAAESALGGLVFGVVAGTLTAILLHGAPALMAVAQGTGAFDLPTQLMISLGAGIYEELLFRVLLVGSLAWAARRRHRCHAPGRTPLLRLPLRRPLRRCARARLVHLPRGCRRALQRHVPAARPRHHGVDARAVRRISDADDVGRVLRGVQPGRMPDAQRGAVDLRRWMESRMGRKTS